MSKKFLHTFRIVGMAFLALTAIINNSHAQESCESRVKRYCEEKGKILGESLEDCQKRHCKSQKELAQ